MRVIDEHFLRFFKDIKFELNTQNPGTEKEPNYIIKDMKTNTCISQRAVLRLVKDCQDSLIDALLNQDIR